MEGIMARVANEMVRVFTGNAKMAGHSLKVYGYACLIAEGEALSPHHRKTLEMAALLHDIGIPRSIEKYRSAAGPYQEQEGPPIAREILTNLGVKPERIARVCRLIGIHHTYGLQEASDYQILLDADFIVNVEEGSLKREAVLRQLHSTTGKALFTALLG